MGEITRAVSKLISFKFSHMLIKVIVIFVVKSYLTIKCAVLIGQLFHESRLKGNYFFIRLAPGL